jgi:hypothetical protein
MIDNDKLETLAKLGSNTFRCEAKDIEPSESL